MTLKFDNHARVIVTGALVSSLALALPAFAAGSPQQTAYKEPASDLSSFLPPQHEQGKVAFRTGGVGQYEAEAMKAAASKYPLDVEFVKQAAGTEEYLAGVDVSILDNAGKPVLKTTTDGPFLLAKLPPGRYTLVAKNDNIPRQRHVTVPARGTDHVVIGW
jgi:hypothetical protein